MGEKPGFNPDKKIVIENSIVGGGIDGTDFPENTVIKGKVIIGGKEIDKNSQEGKDGISLLEKLKRAKQGISSEQPESPRREAKILSIKELIDKGIDEKTAQRIVREQMEDQQDFEDASKGIELLAQFKKAKREGEQRRCAKCNSLIESSAKFCSTCGGKVENEKPKNCPKCGGVVQVGASFCGECGKRL